MSGTVTKNEGGVGHRAAPALAWSFANTMVGRLGTLAIGIVLARLLGPEEFGTFAVAFVALMAILSFNELGVSLAIVRWTGNPARIAPTVNTICVGMSALLTLAAIAAAPAFAHAMGDPEATGLVRLLSLCVLINGVVATPAALMQRRFRQDQRMAADQANVWVGAIVSVGLAAAGMGAVSLVVGRLAGSLVSAGIFLRYSPLPYRFGLDRSQVRSLLSFGLPLAGASVVVFLVGFVDQLVVGKLLGSVMLGYYVLAYNLASWPVSMFSQPLRSVAPAHFARLQDDPPRMRSDFAHVLRPLAAVALPICAVISATAPSIIAFVYGEQWAAAAGILRWLAILAALRIFFELVYDYLVVVGRSKAILTIQVVWIAALVPALVVGVERLGVNGAGVTLVAVATVISLPMYLSQLSRAGIRSRVVLRAVALPCAASAVVVAGAVALGESTLHLFWSLAAAGTFAALVCGVLLFVMRSDIAVFRGRAA